MVIERFSKVIHCCLEVQDVSKILLYCLDNLKNVVYFVNTIYLCKIKNNSKLRPDYCGVSVNFPKQKESLFSTTDFLMLIVNEASNLFYNCAYTICYRLSPTRVCYNQAFSILYGTVSMHNRVDNCD